MKTFTKVIAVFILLISSASCTKNENPNMKEPEYTSYKIAVIMPGGGTERWKSTTDLFINNLKQAQLGLPKGVMIDIEWYDESTINIANKVTDLTLREDIVAIVGPMLADNMAKVIDICKKKKKMLISLTASSDELARMYVDKKIDENSFLMLSESGVTQCEGLISVLKSRYPNVETINILAKDDTYGKTYIDWLPLVATEMDIMVGEVLKYDDTNLETKLDKILSIEDDNNNANVILLSSVNDYKTLATIDNKYTNMVPILTGDNGYYATEVLKKDELPFRMDGLTTASDPASGFDVSYHAKFDKKPTLGEAHLYDALLILGYSLFDMQASGEKALISSVRRVVSGTDMSAGELGWMAFDMREAFALYNQGKFPNIKGTTGDLEFDKKNGISVLQSNYMSWSSYYKDVFETGYFSSKGSYRTDPTLSNYNWNKLKTQEFQDIEKVIYPELKDKWALVVAASESWSNYRHQADALSIYDVLVKNGFPRDHIVLIMADDIAANPLNRSEQGVIKITPDGQNLYSNVKADYKLSSITPEDIERILMGEKSEKLPKVISATENDNLFLFWSGHGSPGLLLWGKNNYSFSSSSVAAMISRLEQKDKYRKMMFVIESCYSGSVGVECAKIAPEGVLLLTAANPNETSKAILKDENLGVFRSNSFTLSFRDMIVKNPNVTLRELYFETFKNTLGSHVSIYNETSFGSVYQNKMDEFIIYK